MNCSNCTNCACGEKWKDQVYLLLRVVVGFVFLYHGYGKVFGEGGVDAVAGFFSGAGIPAAGVMAFLVSYGEFLGGIALILGFLTHWVAKANILIMLGAIYFVHFTNGYSIMNGGYEYALLLLVVNVFFMVNGSGKYSLDAKCKKDQTQ